MRGRRMDRLRGMWLLLLMALPGIAPAQIKPVKQVTDAAMVGNMVWSADTLYVLNGFVFVEAGGTLTIPAGTTVKGRPGTGASASALIVARGGKLFATGTATNPVIFTAEA